MGPTFKTFLKVFLGAVGAAAAAFLIDPSNYVAFGSLAVLFAAVGGVIASLIEKALLKLNPPA